ncbi:MAG TPA: acetyl-CoA carboxylase biotin carboxyl carrier protein [Thermomicrobiales bacterium]|nr:acetyl-CoA carboxylase biotin carboxyl carrier protein [Thermomicrobiales bacterium]
MEKGMVAEGLPEGLTAEVRALIEMMARGGIAELRLETAAVKLRLRAHGAAPAAHGPAAGPTHAPRIELLAEGALEGFVVAAPMIGTFYNAAGPGEPPFVQLGDAVEAGQTVGIIEAMKIMNEVTTEHAGVVAEILVANGQPVEYGQPLLRLVEGAEQDEPDADRA